jgi:hypothetical protein
MAPDKKIATGFCFLSIWWTKKKEKNSLSLVKPLQSYYNSWTRALTTLIVLNKTEKWTIISSKVLHIDFIQNRHHRNTALCVLSIISTKIGSAMKNQIYKGSSLTMFITFILHCALKDTRASGSLFQYMLADPIRDHGLTVRCFFHYSFGRYSWTIDHLYLTVLSVDHPSCRPSIIHDGTYHPTQVLMITLLVSLFILMLYSVRQLPSIIVHLLLMIVTNWFLARYCYSINIWYDVDIFIVYFFVWQFVCLISKWIHQDLPYLSFTLHQKACCLCTAFLTFMVYDIVLRFVPIYVNLAFIWLMSVVDM